MPIYKQKEKNKPAKDLIDKNDRSFVGKLTTKDIVELIQPDIQRKLETNIIDDIKAVHQTDIKK